MELPCSEMRTAWKVVWEGVSGAQVWIIIFEMPLGYQNGDKEILGGSIVRLKHRTPS